MRRFNRIFVYIVAIVLVCTPFSAGAYDAGLYYNAGAVHVMCVRTGDAIYESNAHLLHYPASLVKVMTALLVLEHVSDLNETVTISEHAATLPWYAASMSLQAGDSMTVWDALHGIMLPSANEVANMLAEHVAGTIPAFIAMMNARAWELGAYNTRFVNACGLPGDGQFITAHDMSLIMREAVKHPAFLEIINTEFYDFPPSYRHPDGRTMRNTNRLIREEDDLFNPHIVGGKTGWIIAARNTLSTYAVRDEHELIITVLYSYYRADTFIDTTTLMYYGFARLEYLFPPYTPREIVPSSPEEIAAAIALYLYETQQAATLYEAQQAVELYETEDPPIPEEVQYAANPATPEPTPTPWQSLTSFARSLAFVLIILAIFTGMAVIIIWRYKKWTFSSKISQP